MTDPTDFLSTVEQFPEQLEEAINLGEQAPFLPKAKDFTSILVLGIGGSGLAGDVLKTSAKGAINCVIESVKGYELPSWVGPQSLVFAISYSGNTEETGGLFKEAVRKGASTVVISAGGELAKLAAGTPAVRIPPGLQPRAALGYLTIPLFVILERMGIWDSSPDVAEAHELIKRRSQEYGRENGSAENLARRLAGELKDKVPVIYGTEGIGEVAAYRWKCQLNETAKVPAFFNRLPEMNHNELMGWHGSDKGLACPFEAVFLSGPDEPPQMVKRIKASEESLKGRLGGLHRVTGEGKTRLAQILDLAYLGDFVATYLAMERGVDPSPIDAIEALKRKVASPSHPLL